MATRLALTLCVLVGASLAYNARESSYYVGPNDPYAVEVNSNFLQEPSQRLFWDKFGNNGSGSNQVGGTGVWAMLTNKFPWLNNMFGRMEVAPLSGEYGAPQYPYQQQPYFYQQVPQVYNQRVPQVYNQRVPQVYNQRVPQVYNQQLPHVYNQQLPQVYNQQLPQIYNQQVPYPRYIPGRNVGVTDDAVIVTPPQVPIFPQAPSAPAPAPIPAPEPSPQGYQYNKPQYKLELPHK